MDVSTISERALHRFGWIDDEPQAFNQALTQYEAALKAAFKEKET